MNMATFSRVLNAFRNSLLLENYIFRSSVQIRKNVLSNLIARRPKRLSRLHFGSFLTSTLMASRGLGWFSSSTDEKEEVAGADKPTPDDIAIEESDRLYYSYEIMANYNHLIKFKDSHNDKLLWRLARAIRDVSYLNTTSAEDRKRLTYEALKVAKRALDINDRNYSCHKWYAICISNVGDYEGTKQKIANAYLIKEHFEKAIELNPKDATSVHLLGLWCFTFAEMPWYQQKIAGMIFATPPTSSYEEALKHFANAEEIDPNFYSKNLLYLGKAYEKIGNKKLALLYLQKARDAPALKEEEHQTKKEATELLKRLTK